jgi:RNA polymerase sigma-70 factor (ECF subfamily)
MSTDRPRSPDGADDVEALWQLHRRRMLDIGYRMLGSVTDAEDVAAEAYARLIATDLDDVDDLAGWLVAVTARLCVDRLRSADTRKRAYVGPWLPEPLVQRADSKVIDPADRITLDDSVRMALLVVLERLSPAERTSFVLHDLFAISFDEVADIVGRSPAACRQLASRARRRIQADPERPRIAVSSDEVEAVARRFADACSVGEIEPLVELLDPAAIGDFDSGGTIPGAPLQTIDGAEHIARILLRAFQGHDLSYSVAAVNGEPGVVVESDGRVAAVIAIGVRAGRIDLIHAIGNPAKLQHLTRGETFSGPSRWR